MNAEALSPRHRPAIPPLIADMRARRIESARAIADGGQGRGSDCCGRADSRAIGGILVANAENMTVGQKNGLSGAILDRLRLDKWRLNEAWS